MKYKVSVIKLVTLVLIGALAVAMVACQAATPKPAEKGDTGDPGAPGEQGEQGEPGTTDNDPPMASKDFDMVYLALAGTGVMDKTKPIDLSKYFSDAENAKLSFKADTSDKAIATVKGADTTGMLIVEGKTAGMATITVKAYDGVNTEYAMSSFDVMVVASNARPIVTLDASFNAATDATDSSMQALRMKLYSASRKTTIGATIHAGDDTFPDDVTFSVDMGGAGASDDVVAVDVTKKAGEVNKWEIEVTPMRSGIQNVYVTVKDKFGATAETPSDDDPDTTDTEAPVLQRFQFVAFVNAVPKLDKALPDQTILVSDATLTAEDYYIKISEHFETAEKAAVAGPKIGEMHTLAPAPNADPATEGTGGFIPAVDVGNDTACTASTTDNSVVVVSSTATFADPAVDLVTIDTGDDDVFIQGREAGTAIVTVTCRDDGGFVSSAATITVRDPR